VLFLVGFCLLLDEKPTKRPESYLELTMISLLFRRFVVFCKASFVFYVEIPKATFSAFTAL